MKRSLCALWLALVLSLTACGGDTVGPGQPALPDTDGVGSSLSGTYWTAVRREKEDEYTGAVESNALPTEHWWADLRLNEDGSAMYREVLRCFYNLKVHDGQWQQENGKLTLTADSIWPPIEGYPEGDTLVLEYRGQRFYLEQAEPPTSGGELCAADAQGVWKQVGARGEGLAACLYVDERWSDWYSNYLPTATLYTAEGLDTNEPEYERYEKLELEVLDTPAIEGLSNQCWSLRLSNEEAELLVTMTDMDTLYLRDESGKIGVFERVNSRLPDEVSDTMWDLPIDTTIFYWVDPASSIREQLDFWPLIRLEESCENRVLIVSRWEDLQIQVYSGTPLLNADGSMAQWLTDELLYETTLGLNEPLYLGLSIPEGTAELCLFFKLPGGEVWWTWPFTDQEPYRVEGHTYFTKG